MNDWNNDYFVNWYKMMHQAYYKNDIGRIRNIIESIPSKSPFNLVGTLLLEKINVGSINNNNKNELKFYLLNANRWSEYHILLFILSTKCLHAEELIFLFGNFAKNITNISTYSSYSKDITLAILSIIEECLIKKK